MSSYVKKHSLMVFFFYRKLYYADQGGNGLPSKIGGMSLSGSNPFVVLQRRVEKPEYITLDRNTETLYWTDSGRQWVSILNLGKPSQVGVMEI